MNLKNPHFWLLFGIALLVCGSVVTYLGAGFPGFVICTIGSIVALASPIIADLNDYNK